MLCFELLCETYKAEIAKNSLIWPQLHPAEALGG